MNILPIVWIDDICRPPLIYYPDRRYSSFNADIKQEKEKFSTVYYLSVENFLFIKIFIRFLVLPVLFA